MKKSIGDRITERRPLYSTFGLAMLRLQEEMRASVESPQENGIAPNYYRVELLEEEESSGSERDAFRSDLLGEMQRFAEANEWSFRSRPVLSVTYLPLTDNRERCSVEACHIETYGRLEVADDNGLRDVELSEPVGVIGREHSGPPRSFVPVADASRSLSREHLRISFGDAGWQVELLGQNETTLNGEVMEHGCILPMRPGDTISCEPHTIRLLTALEVD